MKAKIKMLLPGFTGNMDDVVIYYNSKLNCYVTRRKVTPRKSVSTKRTSDIYKFAKRINLSQAWKMIVTLTSGLTMPFIADKAGR